MFNTDICTTVDEALEQAAALELSAYQADEAFEAALIMSEADRFFARALALEAA